MGKLNIFEISLANKSEIFYSGNIVVGHVTVELIKPMQMRGIQLKFEGKAHVEWKEGSEDTLVSASEEYFNQDVLLYGIWTSQGSDNMKLAAGRHTFPFQFHLPKNVPSSFEDAPSHVRYQIRCKIDKPWRPWNFDHNIKRVFTVINLLDLNTQPEASRRQSGEKDKNLCCLCCKSGPISVQFHIDRQGWVPGEAIKLYADISNGTSSSMDKSYVNLSMKTTFHAKKNSITKTLEVARVTRPFIQSHSEDQWTGELLVIPPLPPSFLVGCSLIDIQYILQLVVDPSGLSLDLKIPLPIIIGTIPLMSVIQETPPMAPVHPPMTNFGVGVDPSAPPKEVLYPFPPGFDISNLPPPSYHECFTGPSDTRDDDDNKHTQGNLIFAPAYTYYNWGHQATALPANAK